MASVAWPGRSCGPRAARRRISSPQHTRLIELMDNRDGTLSVFATALDTAAPTATPAPGTPAAGMTDADLGSISRILAANVRGGLSTAAAVTRGGVTGARDLELLLRDPR